MLHAIDTRQLRLPAPETTLSLSDITARAATLGAYDGHERVWLGRDEARGLTAIVAVHSTALGPALGGTRIWPHPSFEAALTDALRLSRGMTDKAAVAGLPLGGGKAVIMADPRRDKTPDLLEAYAEMLTALAGQYYTAEDVGMTLADADFLGERAPNVAGTTRGSSGDPSPFTARGVFLGLKEAMRRRCGSPELEGVTVAVQGLGSVGWTLADALHGEGARLIVADLDRSRAEKAATVFGAAVTEPDRIHAADADVYAPCALGGVLSASTIPEIRATIVAGAANNQLATAEDAEHLAAHGILHAPDFVINAGGLINVAAEIFSGGYDGAAAMEKVACIPATLAAIFDRSEAEGRTPDAVARAIAAERVARG
ncbi:MAG TPA: Glu/Leu/Phe/Val dehydrogenase [Rhizobiales bacterium]|nr:Glu/Leu/Phe/Val dehydrogenase [Hyphomicrobiales bacterium]